MAAGQLRNDGRRILEALLMAFVDENPEVFHISGSGFPKSGRSLETLSSIIENPESVWIVREKILAKFQLTISIWRRFMRGRNFKIRKTDEKTVFLRL